MSEDITYQFEPEQQEIDWNNLYVWFARSFYLLLILAVFILGLVYIGNGRTPLIVLPICAILYQIYWIGYEYYRKEWVDTHTYNKGLSIKRDNSVLLFFKHEEPYIEVPLDDIQEVQIKKDKRASMKAMDSGYGIVLNDMNHVQLEEEQDYVDLVEQVEREGAHIWVDSCEVGTEGQNEEFETWLKSIIPEEKFTEVEFEQARWNRLDWILLLGIIGVVSTIIFAQYYGGEQLEEQPEKSDRTPEVREIQGTTG